MVHLFSDKEVIAQVRIPYTSGHLSFWGLDVGRDRVSQVSQHYPDAFPFSSRSLIDVSIDFLENVSVEKMADIALGTQ